MTSCRCPLHGVRFGADEIPRRPPSHPGCAVPSVRHVCRAFPPDDRADLHRCPRDRSSVRSACHGAPRLVALLHRLWRRVWSSQGEIATTRSTRAVTKGGGERVDDQQVNQTVGPAVGQSRGRPRAGVVVGGRAAAAQPTGLAAGQRPGDPARRPGDHRGRRRVHPRPARGPAARRDRGGPDGGLRPRHPARRDGQPHPGVRPPDHPAESPCRHVDSSTGRLIALWTAGGAGVRRGRRRRRGALVGARDPAQPQVHVRDLRDRLVQPVPARGRGRGRGGARPGVQPAAGLRRLRAGQDPPPARDRALRPQPLQRRQGALRVERGVHQRVHQRDPRRPAGPVQAASTATSTCC